MYAAVSEELKILALPLPSMASTACSGMHHVLVMIKALLNLKVVTSNLAKTLDHFLFWPPLAT